MRIFGLDFTSAPSLRKPITLAACELDGTTLSVKKSIALPDFRAFEAFLQQDGPWLAAFDFPFGQPRRLLNNLDWPQTWQGYVQLVVEMGKGAFEETLTQHREGRPTGDKLYMREVDVLAGSRSPMMMHRVPVGKMFFQGVPRLLTANVSILPCRATNANRIVIEGYPALVARHWAGKVGYKSDERKKQTADQRATRQRIVDGIRSDALAEFYGVRLQLDDELVDRLVQEPMGDELDAVLCAVQAAWAYTQRKNGYGIPLTCDAAEGWIVDPSLFILAPQ